MFSGKQNTYDFKSYPCPSPSSLGPSPSSSTDPSLLSDLQALGALAAADYWPVQSVASNVMPSRSSLDKPPSPQRQTCLLFTRRQAKNDLLVRSPVKISGKEIKIGSALEGGTATDRASYIIGLVTKAHQNPVGEITVQLVTFNDAGGKEDTLHSSILEPCPRERIAVCSKKEYKYGIIVPIDIQLALDNDVNVSAIIKVTVADQVWITSKFKIRPHQRKKVQPLQ